MSRTSIRIFRIHPLMVYFHQKCSTLLQDEWHTYALAPLEIWLLACTKYSNEMNKRITLRIEPKWIQLDSTQLDSTQHKYNIFMEAFFVVVFVEKCAFGWPWSVHWLAPFIFAVLVFVCPWMGSKQVQTILNCKFQANRSNHSCARSFVTTNTENENTN